MTIHIASFGQGKPIVFFHGWGFNSQIWLPLVPYLEKEYQLFLVDLPGFGSSSLLSWTSFKEELLSHLPLQFALIGWSLGGLYAMRLAIEEPNRVDSLISITSSPRFLQDDKWPGVPKQLFQQFYTNLATDFHATLSDFIALQLKKKTQLDFSHFINFSMPAGLKNGLDVLDSWDLREDLHRLDKPSCFIFGELDPIVPIATIQTMKQLYPHFDYLLFKRSTHMPFLLHMDLFINTINEFVQ